MAEEKEEKKEEEGADDSPVIQRIEGQAAKVARTFWVSDKAGQAGLVSRIASACGRRLGA